MDLGSKSITRDFRFEIDLIPEVAPIVEEVLKQMETTTIGVYRPDDEDPFDTIRDDEGNVLLHERADLIVGLQEWLCVACQRIRAEDEGDVVRVIAPAFMDWETYWAKALREGLSTEAAGEITQTSHVFVDEYGTANELSMIQDYWPSRAECWFNAFRGELSSES